MPTESQLQVQTEGKQVNQTNTINNKSELIKPKQEKIIDKTNKKCVRYIFDIHENM